MIKSEAKRKIQRRRKYKGLFSKFKFQTNQKGYKYKSRHKHAKNRRRDKDGKFLPGKRKVIKEEK